MIRCKIIAVGKKHDPLFVDAIEMYERRLKPYCALVWELVPASDTADESVRIIRRAGDSFVLLLDEAGAQYTTQQLASMFEGFQNQAITDVAIIIGGAYGVSDEVKERADTTLSLSALTFPHQLVRLILVEQLYRSLSLLAGSKYHHS